LDGSEETDIISKFIPKEKWPCIGLFMKGLIKKVHLIDYLSLTYETLEETLIIGKIK